MENFDVVNDLLHSHKDKKKPSKLTYGDKDMLIQLQQFLTTFKEASELLQSDLTPELSNVIPTISGLKLACHVPGVTDDDENDPDAKFALEFAGEPRDPEDEDEETPLYRLATSLDKRWQERFGYQIEDEFLEGLKAFENHTNCTASSSQLLSAEHNGRNKMFPTSYCIIIIFIIFYG